MQYNGATNGGAGAGGGGGSVIVSDGPQNKKIRTGVQQPGEGDAHMHVRVSDFSFFFAFFILCPPGLN